ncbi:MAG: peptide chain release factor-like protein [Planctomycetota bacterium]
MNDCSIRRTRRSGPGGQHRNKVETAVILCHQPTGTEAEANERRSQAENKRVALIRLRLSLAIQVRSPEPADSPSICWSQRTKNGKIAISATHGEFPALLAEALDQIVALEFEIPAAAKSLAVTTSQLIRMLKKHMPAFEFVNRERTKLDKHRLK